MPDQPGLAVRGLGCRYPGGGWILRGVELGVRPGECVAAVGGNGAGKSTLLSILSGVVPQFLPGELEGSAEFNGAPLLEPPPAPAASAIPQAAAGRIALRPAYLRQNVDDQLLCDSVQEELEFFLRHSRACGTSGLTAAGLADRVGISDLRHRLAHRLSGGEKQRFALACSLGFSDAGLILLDEPTAFLDDDGRRRLQRMLAGYKERGACILLAGHEFQGLEDLVDRQFRLGPDPRPGPRLRSAPPASGPVLLETEDLAVAADDGRPVFGGLRISLRGGEIAGLCGPNGCGKSRLARVLAGMELPAGGRVLLNGRPAGARTLWAGVALSGQNPFHGLLYPDLDACLRAAWSGRSGEPAVSREQGAALLGLQGLLGRDPQTLSFGEAQKASILCAALAGPQVLVVDEPLLDLDAASLGGVRELCAAVAGAGGAVLMISHVPAVLAGICSRAPISWEEADACAMMRRG